MTYYIYSKMPVNLNIQYRNIITYFLEIALSKITIFIYIRLIQNPMYNCIGFISKYANNIIRYG